jgi:hypothetical protein
MLAVNLNIRLNHRSFIFRKQPVPFKPRFPITGAVRESRRQEKRVNAVLVDAPVKVALEARAKSVHFNRFFSGSQEKSQNTKQLKRNVRRVDFLKREMYLFVLDLRNLSECPEAVQNGPMTIAPYSAPSVSVAAATLTAIQTISRL